MSSICHLLGTTTHYGEALFILGRRAVPNCCRLLMQKFACHSNLPSLIQVLHSCVHALQVAAAREAIGDADFFLIARTDARATSSKRGLDEAINRANIYLVPILSLCICVAFATLSACTLFFGSVNGHFCCFPALWACVACFASAAAGLARKWCIVIVCAASWLQNNNCCMLPHEESINSCKSSPCCCALPQQCLFATFAGLLFRSLPPGM